MKSITLKNIPAPIHTALKERAKLHGRSLNREAIACLEMAVAPVTVNVSAMLQDIRAHRSKLPGKLSERLIQTANEGRP